MEILTYNIEYTKRFQKLFRCIALITLFMGVISIWIMIALHMFIPVWIQLSIVISVLTYFFNATTKTKVVYSEIDCFKIATSLIEQGHKVVNCELIYVKISA